jgi:hypothetical protein
MKKSIQKINCNSNKGHKEKSTAQPTRMPIVRCTCGLEILVVPDLKAMDLAINKHVAEHKQSREGSKKLTDFLTEQVLIMVSKNKNLSQL